MKRLLGSLAVSVAIVVLFVGCEENTYPPPHPPILGSVEVVMETDTAYAICGDTTVVYGFAKAKAWSGNGIPGYRVTLSLRPINGYIRFINADLRDTTDNAGFVHFAFTSFSWAVSYVETFTAMAEGSSDTFQLHVILSSEPQYVHIEADPDTLHQDGREGDSTSVTATLCPMPYPGIPGFHYEPWFPWGRLRYAEPMDDHGVERYEWYLGGIGLGRHVLYAQYGSLVDSAVVVVLP